MKKNLLILTSGLGAIAALLLSSCAYDPYYGGGASYSSYGHGYGYGGSSFSTTTFVSTGNARWGYDPYCRAYYDYNRRAYYDPYLYGYYPVGYRPPVLVGVPHPKGWRNGYCPPPSRVTNITLKNYGNRESAYRGSNHSWARQVRHQQVSPRNSNPGRGQQNQWNRGNQRDPRAHGAPGNSGNRNSGNWNQNNRQGRAILAPPSHNRSSSVQGRQQPRVPSHYNTPVQTRPDVSRAQNRDSRVQRQTPAPAAHPQNQGRQNLNRGNTGGGSIQRQAPAPRGGENREIQRSDGGNRQWQGGGQAPQRSEGRRGGGGRGPNRA